jgi:hypothetical protein
MSKKHGMIRRRYALTNTASGVAGEVAVAAALIRAGFLVAKPYWNDDEIDLLILCGEKYRKVQIPVQVKSVQQLGSSKDEKQIQGLKKRYVENNAYLCLAIYSPEHNKIWFIDGSDNIKKIHAEGVIKSKGKKGRSRTSYKKIGSDADVPIYINISEKGDSEFDDKYLIDTKYADKITNQIKRISDLILNEMKEVHDLEGLWTTCFSEIENDKSKVKKKK